MKGKEKKNVTPFPIFVDYHKKRNEANFLVLLRRVFQSCSLSFLILFFFSFSKMKVRVQFNSQLLEVDCLPSWTLANFRDALAPVSSVQAADQV